MTGVTTTITTTTTTTTTTVVVVVAIAFSCLMLFILWNRLQQELVRNRFLH